MRALRDLARFVRAKDTEEERQEIREYASTRVTELAHALDLDTAVLRSLIESVEDARLAAVLLLKTKQARSKLRDQEAADRVSAAQASADILGSVVEWQGHCAHLDVISLLAASLTARADMLVFTCRTFVVSIPMAQLFDVRRLGRIDLTGFVDGHGLHIRWASGGLNFRSRLDPRATSVTVHLPRCAALAA